MNKSNIAVYINVSIVFLLRIAVSNTMAFTFSSKSKSGKTSIDIKRLWLIWFALFAQKQYKNKDFYLNWYSDEENYLPIATSHCCATMRSQLWQNQKNIFMELYVDDTVY